MSALYEVNDTWFLMTEMYELADQYPFLHLIHFLGFMVLPNIFFSLPLLEPLYGILQQANLCFAIPSWSMATRLLFLEEDIK